MCSKCPPCARMQAGRRGRHCLIASSMNTWWKCSHSSIRHDFSWSTSWIRLRYTRSCSFPQIWLAGKLFYEFFAPYPFSCLSTLINTRSSAENTMFIVYDNCLQVTSNCMCWKLRYFVIGIWILIIPLSNNIFSWNLVVISQIYSETSVHNFIRIHSDLTFLSHIV